MNRLTHLIKLWQAAVLLLLLLLSLTVFPAMAAPIFGVDPATALAGFQNRPAQQGPGQPAGSDIWLDISQATSTNQGDRLIFPRQYRLVAAQLALLQPILDAAPLENNVTAQGDRVILPLPLPDGSFGQFWIEESPIMEAALAAQFPEIKTYQGWGIDDPTATARLDWTPAGFHGLILSSGETVYIDPYQKGDIVQYMSYYKRDYTNFWGKTRAETFLPEEQGLSSEPGEVGIATSGPTLRTYRLAVATTGEYTTFHDDGNNTNGDAIADAMAAIVTTMNRVNGIYIRELSIRMNLIANNNQIVYTNAGTDPYTNNNGGTMLGENQTNIDAVIGNANYDIGHVFSTGGGGIASLQSVCNNPNKARGVTGSGAPIGDPFDVDYVAHEMGHQFGGNHTFNAGNASNCDAVNRNAGTAYEPGSGSTIMAYAGICGNQDLQNNSDDYFHGISHDEIINFVTAGGGSSCGVATATGNNPPTVQAGPDYTIPRQTPFSLNGSATDPESDPLTYNWEEFDLGAAWNDTGAMPNTDNDGNARPIFRSFRPTPLTFRIFPSLANILDGSHANRGESLPNIARTMQFRLTARDNLGGVNQDTMAVTVDAGSGPFAVTAPNTGVTWPGLSAQTVTWNVANTTAPPVSCANVNILLSTDGGNTFPHTLAGNTANDGTQNIILPYTPTATARVKVECAGNIFFDISNANFTISEVTVPVTKSASPNPALAGEALTYTIRVDNPVAVTLNATITDTLPLSVATASPTVWSGVAIAVGGFWQQDLVVTVDPLAEGFITNTVHVTTVEGPSGQFQLSTQVIPRGKIIVDACPDQDADGVCGPGDPLPPGVLGCLQGILSGDLGCQPVPALFAGLDPDDTYTPYLQFTGPSQGYYQTTHATGIQVTHGQVVTTTLGAVYPVHPTGIAVHQPSNKVYAAFQGAKIGNDWPYPFIAVIDSNTDVVSYTIGEPQGIGRQPWGVAVSGDNVYVGSYGEGRVDVINANTDLVIANITPNRADFRPAAPAVNTTNGQVHFPDARGRRLVILDGTAIVADRLLNFLTDSFRPLEVAVNGFGQGHSFVSMRNPNGTQTVGIAETDEVAAAAAQPGVTSILPPPLSFHSSYAMSLWPQGSQGDPRLFVTYADNSRPGSPYPNPNRLAVYSFSPGNPGNLLQRQANIRLNDYAEAGLIYDDNIGGLLGLYGGFDYDNNQNHINACSNPARGGTYALNFNGAVQPGPAPSIVVGSPPLTTSTTLQWRNPYELAINPANGKVYVTDRCWNEFPTPGGGYPGGGAVLVFPDSAVSISEADVLLEPEPFIPATEPEATPTPLPTATATPEPTFTPSPVVPVEPTLEPDPIGEPEPTSEPAPPDGTAIAVLSGQVTLVNGQGEASITLEDTGQSATTDAEGFFSLDNVAEGPYTSLTADAPGHLPAVCAQPTVVAPETRLAAVTLLGGDLNDDNRVDIADLTLAAGSYGQTGPDLAADLNADGTVNIFDLQLIAANFGQGVQVWSCQ